MQCTNHLSDKATYRIVHNYPKEEIKRQCTHLPITSLNFKATAKDSTHSSRLNQIPQFYGIPKIHKAFVKVPPVRPIVSQCTSLLKPIYSTVHRSCTTAIAAKSYSDYLHNSTTLSITLQDLYVPDEAILITVDVSSLILPYLNQKC